MKNRKEMIWPEDFINKIICGDSLSVMKKMPDESIDMIITSPPYWGLRDYGFEQIFGGDPDCEHTWTTENVYHDNLRFRDPNKTAQLRSNKNPKIFTDPKLKQGDCIYCGAWKGQLGLEPIPELYIEHLTEIFNEIKRVLKKEGTLWLNMGDTYWSAKGSCFNPGGGKNSLGNSKKKKGIYLLHRGNKSDIPNLPQKSLTMIPERLAWSLIQNGWILRNKIIWEKPNCMPSSTKDRYTNKYEFVYYFVKSQSNYFDLDSIREPHLSQSIKRAKGHDYSSGPWAVPGGINGEHGRLHESGKNPGDIWIIPTVACPFPGVHFATFPEKLCEKAIIPGSPENGIVLDPFCGVGTALYVAKELRRRFIGIDIKKEYCEKSKENIAQGIL